MADAGQLNTYRGVITVYTGLMLPFSTFLLASFFQTMPREIIDAARLDGAGHLRILGLIVMPMSLPALVTVCVVQAIWVWNEVLIAVVFLQSEHLRTLMVGVTIFRSRYHLDVPIVMAGMLWATFRSSCSMWSDSGFHPWADRRGGEGMRAVGKASTVGHPVRRLRTDARTSMERGVG